MSRRRTTQEAAVADAPARRRRLDGDDGSVIVEAAMVLPLLLVLVAGTVDFGKGYRDRLSLQSGVRTAGRIGAASKNYGNADQRILIGLNAGLAGTSSLVLNQVAIFEGVPNGTSTQEIDPSATCMAAPSGSGSGSTTTGQACNTYNGTQVANAATSTSFTSATATSCGAAAWDRFWCPINRDTALTDNGGNGPDFLGVWVKATYTPLTKVITSSVTMTDQVVVRLEPDA